MTAGNIHLWATLHVPAHAQQDLHINRAIISTAEGAAAMPARSALQAHIVQRPAEPRAVPARWDITRAVMERLIASPSALRDWGPM